MSRTLVIQLARFGDLVQTKRLVMSLAQEEGGEVHLCLDRSLVPLARLIYPFAQPHGLLVHGQADAAAFLAANAPVLARLRDLGFDLIYNLNFSGLNFALAALFDPATVRGYRMRKGQQIKDRWPAMAFRWTRRRGSSPMNLADFWAHLHPAPIAPGEVNPPAQPGGQGLGVVLAGRHARRSLPTEVLGRVVAAMAAKIKQGPILLLGSQAERAAAADLKRQLPGRLLDRTSDLTGRTDWAQLLESLSGLDAVLSPDTGTMHLAAHAGAPVTALFLSSAWAWETGPYGLGHQVWQSAAECAPCRESDPCPHGLRCLEPFSQGPLLSALSGRAAAPQGLLLLDSALDELGAAYVPASGQDPAAADRLQARALLAEFLRAPLAAAPRGAEGEYRPELSLFRDPDWMAPPPDAASALN